MGYGEHDAISPDLARAKAIHVFSSTQTRDSHDVSENLSRGESSEQKRDKGKWDRAN